MANNDRFFNEPLRPKIYAYTEPQYKNTAWTGARSGKGLIKVGYTTIDVRERIEQQYPTLRPQETPFEILLEDEALREDGSYFIDKDVHRALKQFGVKNIRGEWFECTVKDVKAAILAVKSRELNLEHRHNNFDMRPEQRRAVDITEAYFKRYDIRKEKKAPHFLWNAKMRFGKTFTAYQLAKRMGWKKILVLTFKPAVQNEWKNDLESHVDFENWQFVSKDTELDFAHRNKKYPCVWFASFQDMLGRTDYGAIKPRNEEAHTVQWDCVILDEYHYGAWNESSKELYNAEDRREQDYNDGGQSWFDDEGDLPITANHYLYLSGTPFRAMSTGEFMEDQIFNWTYSDEQRAKNTWNKKDGKNPYEGLPQMVLMTYQMPKEIRRVALNTETNEFDLNEFFKAELMEDRVYETYKFKHENAVQKWLDLLRGQYLPQNIDELKSKVRPPMPFSDVRLRNSLAHTFWFLPSVAACKAMKRLLEQRANSTFFQDYQIICCAGAEAGIGVHALEPVKEAMGNPLKTKSITLSCGKLTTGVTVPPWSGIFMLRNTSSPETYFQAAFRVQSPWTLHNPDGVHPDETEVVKPICYVFDYAPDRALSEIASYSTKLDYKSKEKPEKLVEDFIRFLPVLCYDGSSMLELNAGNILDLVISGTASTMLARRWQSALLVNVDNDTLQRLLDNPEAMEAIEKIEGFRNLNDDIVAIINRSNALKKLKRDAAESDKALSKKEKKEISDEEKEITSKRKLIREKLIKFATRIPIFMYLTDFREQTLHDVITQLETRLFTRVTGLTLNDFNLLVELGVFNGNVMNEAVFAFKRYEDASLTYTGLDKHEGELIGGFNTQLTREEADALAERNFKTRKN